jgi:hypothetical protein
VLAGLGATGVACASAASTDPTGDAPTVTFDRSTAGCVDGDRDHERFGTDCLCCHSNEFSVAGSIAPDSSPVAAVIVEDSIGGSAVASPNPFGNFFRHNKLVPPLRATIVGVDGRRITMSSPAPDGACNRCHRDGGDAPMLFAPRGPIITQ